MPLGASIPGLKVPIEVIGELSAQAESLADIYRLTSKAAATSTPFWRFFKTIRAFDPTKTVKEVSQLYQAAKYFVDPASYLSRISPDVPLDRRLADLIITKTGLSDRGYALRYRVDLVVEFPDTKTSITKNVWVSTNYELTMNELERRALEILSRKWKPGYKPAEFGGEGPSLPTSMTIVSFERFGVET